MFALGRTDANGMGIAGPIATWNRFCRFAGLVVLLAATAIVDGRTPLYGDFVQFYTTGLIDRVGAWDSLYPLPIPRSIHNAGTWRDATAKPRAARIASEDGVDFIPYYFILPPPAAMLFWPMGYFDGRTAHRLWLLASVLAGWATAVQAGIILQRCAGRPSRWVGLLTLLIAAMPAMRRAVLVANLTPMISATIGWAVLSLMSEEQPLGTAAAIVLGMMTKYASAMFLPIALAQRRWRTIGWTAAIFIAWLAMALAIMGRGPFVEFASAIAPTLGRSHEQADNICLAGVLLHALHGLPPLPAAILTPLAILRLLVLGAILLPMVRLEPKRMREPAAVGAAAISLLAWLLFFSPVAWSHYLIYLCPLWGWLACPTGKNQWQRIMAWIAIALVVLSPDQMPAPAIDPWGVHLLLSLGMMLGLGIGGLCGLVRGESAGRSGVITSTRMWTGRLSDQSAVGI
jgi:hypothetical protein